MLHALALLLPASLRRLACRFVGHLWRPVVVAESAVNGFRKHRRALVTVRASCGLCGRTVVGRALAGAVR